MSTTTTERNREATCPSWCEGGHDTGYQRWEDCQDGRASRDHAQEASSIDVESPAWGESAHVSVACIATDFTDEGGMRPAYVDLSIDARCDHANADLSPTQARELAAQLIAHANLIEREGLA